MYEENNKYESMIEHETLLEIRTCICTYNVIRKEKLIGIKILLIV